MMMMQSNKISIFALLSVSLLLVGGTAGNAFAITVTSDINANSLVNNILGGGITIVGDATLTGTSGNCTPTGTFTDGIASGLGIDEGIVLTSGEVTFVDNTNTLDDSTCVAGNPGDPMLDAIVAPFITFDATVLEFDFEFGDGTVGGDLFFTFQFASEEYNEFVNSDFNDVFGLFVDGVNVALIPGSGGTPVAINTVNCNNPFNPPTGSFCDLFNNNDLDDGGPFFAFEYDGFTDVFEAEALDLGPGTHTMQFKIADTSDEILDSGVFIQAESFSDQPQLTPRDLKLDAIVELEVVKDDINGGAEGVGDPEEAIEEIDKAIEHINESLDPELWNTIDEEIDPFRLNPDEGRKVFGEEKHAAQDIFDSIDEGEISNDAIRDELLRVVNKLVSADRLLADQAIKDAIDNPNADPEEIAEAEEKFAEGEQLIDDAEAESDLDEKEDLIYEAIDDSFRHAWDAAIDAVEDSEEEEEEED